MPQEKLEIAMPDGKTEAYFYRGDKPLPGVLYLTDIFGVREANRGMARRVAEQGYTVLMPNLFYRTSKLPIFEVEPRMGDERIGRRLTELRDPLIPEATERDAASYIDFLASNNAVKSGPIAVVGFCYSGVMAMSAAASRSNHVALVATFHAGRLFTEQPSSPHRQLPRIKARLYFGHAENDKSMPADAIAGFEGALKAWGGRYESETYNGANHGWTVPDSHAYNLIEAERAFRKLTELLKETL